jgi:hypothetical protein
MYLSSPPKNPYDEKLLDMGNFYYFLNKRENLLLFNSIYPKTNDFFIFPSWIWHGSYPQVKGIRQTLNIDFNVKR